MKAFSDFSAVWVVNCEFRPRHGRGGNPLDPICAVFKQWPGGEVRRYWFGDRSGGTGSPLSSNDLVVAFYASAEMNCFAALGWSSPSNIIDLYAEFRTLTNGKTLICGNGLIGALTYFGCKSMPTNEKDQMRSFILAGGPWDAEGQQNILDYCEKDVDATLELLSAMQSHVDLSRALLRGKYSVAVASMETRGIPVDHNLLERMKLMWPTVRPLLINQIDAQYNTYERGAFRESKFAEYLKRSGIRWPTNDRGRLLLTDKTFKEQSVIYPQILPLRQLRKTLSQLKLGEWPVGEDGRNRCMLSMYSSKTGRNQPSTSKFIFGAASWLRSLIQPNVGNGLAYIDWSQQEFGIAAALSGDLDMKQAYMSGDPYLAFAKQARAVPDHATAESHSAERGLFKQCVLAVQYGMNENGLARRISQGTAEARKLLRLHRDTYAKFWQWSDRVFATATFKGRLHTTFGWQILVGAQSNPRSICNFPMQANGAEMLRIACILMVDRGVRLCAPIHDAVLIEAPLDELDNDIALAQDCMREASGLVLDGFELSSDVKIIRYPQRFLDDRGTEMWGQVLGLLSSQDKSALTINNKSQQDLFEMDDEQTWPNTAGTAQ